MEITVHGTILFKGVNQVTIYNREIMGEEVGLSGSYSAAPAAAAMLKKTLAKQENLSLVPERFKLIFRP